jgi:hypothetical protein
MPVFLRAVNLYGLLLMQFGLHQLLADAGQFFLLGL